jgi:hypothetical protein
MTDSASPFNRNYCVLLPPIGQKNLEEFLTKKTFCKVEEVSIMNWTVMAISGRIYGCDSVSMLESSYDG